MADAPTCAGDIRHLIGDRPAASVPLSAVAVHPGAPPAAAASSQPAAAGATAPLDAPGEGTTGQGASRDPLGLGPVELQGSAPPASVPPPAVGGGAAVVSRSLPPAAGWIPAVSVQTPETTTNATPGLATAAAAPTSTTGAEMAPPPSSEGTTAPIPEPALASTTVPAASTPALAPTANGGGQPGATTAASTAAPEPSAAGPSTATNAPPGASGDEPCGSGKQDWPGESYNVGSKVLCTATFDNLQRLAQIVDCRCDDGDGLYSYYVHYVDFDKRLDEWVSSSRLQPFTPGTTTADPLLSPRGAGELLSPVSQERKLTRKLKRRYEEVMHVPKGVEDLPPIDQTLEREHHERTKVKNIGVVEMGKYEMDAWYYSPFPEAYANQDKLYMCEFCLKYMKKKKTLLRHRAKCGWTHPPGDEIYRSPPPPADNPSYVGGPVFSPPVSMFEVDGKQNKIYCQNLCLLSKLFLDHKTLYYDVDPFLFYILTEQDAAGHHVVGYFSKEKASQEEYNLACILTLPPHQRKGYGRFLISFSYELSKKEGRVGTPERPLSDLGQVSYRSYWTRVLLDILKEHKGNLSIKDISQMTAIRPDDIVTTLQSLNLIKYWKGQHIISVTPRVLEEHLKVVNGQKYVSCVDASRIHWAPLLSPTSKKPR